MYKIDSTHREATNQQRETDMSRLSRYTDINLIRTVEAIETDLYYIMIEKLSALDTSQLDIRETELKEDLAELKLELATRNKHYTKERA